MRIISFFILLFISSTSFAGTYDEDLKELFDLAGVRNHYTNLNTFMLSQMQTGFFQEANQKFDVSEYTEAQRKQIGEILKNRFGSNYYANPKAAGRSNWLFIPHNKLLTPCCYRLKPKLL